jgi:hypothetical protein
MSPSGSAQSKDMSIFALPLLKDGVPTERLEFVGGWPVGVPDVNVKLSELEVPEGVVTVTWRAPVAAVEAIVTDAVTYDAVDAQGMICTANRGGLLGRSAYFPKFVCEIPVFSRWSVLL